MEIPAAAADAPRVNVESISAPAVKVSKLVTLVKSVSITVLSSDKVRTSVPAPELMVSLALKLEVETVSKSASAPEVILSLPEPSVMMSAAAAVVMVLLPPVATTVLIPAVLVEV